MIGACIIDGVDIATLGMFIKKDGDADFIAFPSRKEPLKNDWFEHDGVEVDFDTLVFEPKKIKVEYYLSAPNSTLFKERLNAFQNLHLSAGLREVYIREIGHTFSLQVISFGKMTQKGGLYKSGRKSATIEVEYLDNSPTDMFWSAIYDGVNNSGIPTRVLLNGNDMNTYGIIINEFYSTALNLHSPKLGISRDSQFLNGANVDVNFVPKKESRKFSMECTFTAATDIDFRWNYSALFNNFAKKEPLTFTLTNGDVINCYYTGMSNIKKLAPFKRRILFTFTLNFSEI